MAKARPVKGMNARTSLLENARAIVAVRVDEMFGFAGAIGDRDRDRDLHNMRIAAKRLRYTLEMFRSCLGPDGEDLIDAVKEIQERIGRIHDADVLAQVVRDRLGDAARLRVDDLLSAAEAHAPSEDERVAAVRHAAAERPDPTLGLTLLLARTHAGREQEHVDLVAWWADHGGDDLRARLDACLLDTPTA